MKPFALAVTVWTGVHLGLAWPVAAFSVREISVQSRRGEPFRAEVRLSLQGEEQLKDLEVKIGDQKAYRSEALTRPAVADRFRSTPVPGKVDTVLITSDVPIDDAKFDLLLMARSGQITIVQHYPVKLAPARPGLSQVSKVAKTVSDMPVPTAEAPPNKVVKPSLYPEFYGPVDRGITLYSIARSLLVPNDKLWQAAVVLWRVNKAQFVAGNIHGLPAGAYLRIPPDLDEQITTLKMAEAQEFMTNQWDEWAALQRAGISRRQMTLASAAINKAMTVSLQSLAADKEEAAKVAAVPTVTLPANEQASAVPSMALAAGKPDTAVNATELQNLLQGLEDRIMRRLTPTLNLPLTAQGSPTTLNATELQTTLQTFEERLTQRVEQMLAQGGTPVQVTNMTAPSATATAAAATASKTPPARPAEVMQPSVLSRSLSTAHLLILGNVIWGSILGFLSWRWRQRRARLLPHRRI